MTIKEFAWEQWERYGETGDERGLVGVEYAGQFIVNPWIDQSGRFELTDEEAERTYGIAVMQQFALLARRTMGQM